MSLPARPAAIEPLERSLDLPGETERPVTTQSNEAVQYAQANSGKSSVFPVWIAPHEDTPHPVTLSTTSKVTPLFRSFEIVFASYPGVYLMPLSEFSPIVIVRKPDEYRSCAFVCP